MIMKDKKSRLLKSLLGAAAAFGLAAVPLTASSSSSLAQLENAQCLASDGCCMETASVCIRGNGVRGNAYWNGGPCDGKGTQIDPG